MGKENQSFNEAIKTYLDRRSKEDSLFAISYAKANKNISECYDYIIGEARKRGGNAVAMTDDEVFGLAVHYYDEDNIKVKKQSGCKAIASNKQQKQASKPEPSKPIVAPSKRGKKKEESSAMQFLLFDEL